MSEYLLSFKPTTRGFGEHDPSAALFENGELVGGHLGLRIVRTISDAHGWEIRLTESKEGGARVEFRVDDAGTS